jgi:hypothetical protein
VVFSATFGGCAAVSALPPGIGGRQAACGRWGCVKRLAEGNSGCCGVVNRGESYRPRQPEQTVLYQVMAENLDTFLAHERREDRHVPRFVEREFRKFLECGIPSYGFLRLRCDTCGQDKLVSFSCKREMVFIEGGLL